MKHLLRIIEAGKQVGKSFSFNHNDCTYWSSVGIQKHGGAYKVYIDVIEESQMIAEVYEREEVTQFSTALEAIDYITSETQLDVEDLKTCKGQKIFNPSFE